MDTAAMMPPPPPRAVLPQAGEAVRDETQGGAPSPALRDQPHPPGGKGVPSYDAPDWSGVPSASFSLDVLRGGTQVASLPLSGQPFWTFGRHPQCDVVLDHPSSSRLHAVLQFKGTAGGGEAFVWDAGSTHGTFVNKRPVNPRVYVPLRVGDQLRLGQSSRVYVLCGPAELMPEEGLSKLERQQLRALERAAAAAEEEALRAMAIVKARAAAAGRTGGGGATWGQDMSEAADYQHDDGEAAALGLAELDWRTYSGKLNDRQEKCRDRLRRKEATIGNLRSEIDRITAKESSQQGLTAGQAAQVARNEQRIQQLEEELEDAGEALNEQLRESAIARARGAGDAATEAALKAHASAASGGRKGRGKRPAGDDEHDDGGSDSDDIVLDRTRLESKRPRVNSQPADATMHSGAQASASAGGVETAESLWAKRQAVREQLTEAQEAAAQAQAAATAAVASASGDDAQRDALDAYMGGVDLQLMHGAAMQAQALVARLQAEDSRLSRLLKIADPSGFYTRPVAAPAAALKNGPQAPQATPPPPVPFAAATQAAQMAASVLKAPQQHVPAAQTDVAAAADADGFMSPAELRAAKEQQLSGSLTHLPGALGPQRGGLIHMRSTKKAKTPAHCTAAVPEQDEAVTAAAADVARLLGVGPSLDGEDEPAVDVVVDGTGWWERVQPTSAWRPASVDEDT